MNKPYDSSRSIITVDGITARLVDDPEGGSDCEDCCFCNNLGHCLLQQKPDLEAMSRSCWSADIIRGGDRSFHVWRRVG
jgi:hypothetical protein